MTRTRLYCQFRFRFFLGESKEWHCWFSHYDGNYQVQTWEQNCYPQAFSNVTMILTEMSQIRLMLVTVKWCHVTCHTLCHDVTCNMWRSESWDDGIIGMCWLPLYLLFWAPHAIIVQSRRVSRDNEAMSVTRVSILLLLQLLGAASHVTDTLTLPITCHENSRKNWASVQKGPNTDALHKGARVILPFLLNVSR